MPTVQTPKLEVSYLDAGPAAGPVVLLLHGWPDDATTWQHIHPVLNAAGYRTIAPTHRGFGRTRFISPVAHRSGDTASLAIDAIEMLDALNVGCFDVVGHDWGSNISETLAVGWPQRVERLAMLSTPSRLGGLKTPPFWHARLQWYHWYQATHRGADAVRSDPIGFAKIMWDTWSPQGWYEEATFEQVSKSFANPDFVDITLHSYRARWGDARPDPDSQWLDSRVKETTALAVPALFIQGTEDGVNPPATSEHMHEKFTAGFGRELLKGVGHFPTREAPARVAQLLIEHLRRP